MVINMEWGGFGSSSSISHLPFHNVDLVIDSLSPNEGSQLFEKMISGMYLGDIARLLLLQLYHSGAVFTGVARDSKSPASKNPGKSLSPPGAITSEWVSQMGMLSLYIIRFHSDCRIYSASSCSGR